jgi:hypothetical protein
MEEGQMFIRSVDEGLEQFLRAGLPLPPEVGDVSFDAPDGTWAAQLSRLTVNLYLYDVTRSTQPSRAPMQRSTGQGAPQRRTPQPMVELGYLVSAWAGTPRDEHQLLGDVVSLVAAHEHLAPELLGAPVSSSVWLNFGDDSHNRPRDLWSALGGSLKASFTLHVTVAADSFDWTEQAPAVQRIVALTAPIPRATPR